MKFRNREEAGKLLGEKLLSYNFKNPIIFGIPRGGVIVAYQISKILRSPLSVVIVSKIPAYFDSEYGIGALTEDGKIILREPVNDDYLDKIVEKIKIKIKKRVELYRGKKDIENLSNKTAIIVDDGIATGETITAAINSIKNKEPEKIVVAVPVSSIDAKLKIEREVDYFVSLYTPEIFYAVSMFYEDFEQVEDDYVINILKKGESNERI
ncbi:MAG: phosphoribosyltransferase [Caldisericia bacterium]